MYPSVSYPKWSTLFPERSLIDNPRLGLIEVREGFLREGATDIELSEIRAGG